jgi:hypothetical protein
MELVYGQKQTFAKNIDGLLNLLGLSRKDAAEQIGVTYKLIRRLVSAGISRPDDRNRDNLLAITRFFALPSIQHLWHENLVDDLLAQEEGLPFVEKFRPQLLRSREDQMAKLIDVDDKRLERLHRALGFTIAMGLPIAMRPDAAGAGPLEKVKAILASDEALVQHFPKVIEAYYQLATRKQAQVG